MGRRGQRSARPFAGAVARWRAVPGGVDSHGRVVTKPRELENAQWVLAMCQRFGCLPSQLLAEDASFLRLLALEELAADPEV
ncbi:hypothetical protein GCM10009850_047710 [Nonomuraea monospora]|uniref:Transposase n=1 Tax=Nonomuraea monospora TaxID=568818 RepID=A0ABN3CK21_9ACTN